MARTLKYKDINLIAAQDRRRRAAKEERVTAVRLPILVLVLVLLLLGSGYYYLVTETGALESAKADAAVFVNDPTTLAAYEASLKLQDQATRMAAQKNELGQVLLNLSSYPDMAGGDFHTIYSYADTRVSITNVSYNRASGVLTFNAESTTVTGVPVFIAQLRMSSIFADVKYLGYTEQITTTIVQLPPRQVQRVDEYGNPVFNPLTGEPVFDSVPQSRTDTHRSFLFSVTALMKSPEPHFPYPGQSVSGN